MRRVKVKIGKKTTFNTQSRDMRSERWTRTNSMRIFHFHSYSKWDQKENESVTSKRMILHRRARIQISTEEEKVTKLYFNRLLHMWNRGRSDKKGKQLTMTMWTEKMWRKKWKKRKIPKRNIDINMCMNKCIHPNESWKQSTKNPY